MERNYFDIISYFDELKSQYFVEILSRAYDWNALLLQKHSNVIGQIQLRKKWLKYFSL